MPLVLVLSAAVFLVVLSDSGAALSKASLYEITATSQTSDSVNPNCLLDPSHKGSWRPLSGGRFFEERLDISARKDSAEPPLKSPSASRPTVRRAAATPTVFGMEVEYRDLTFKMINPGYGDLFVNSPHIVRRTLMDSKTPGMTREKIFFHCNDGGCHSLGSPDFILKVEGKGSRPEIAELLLIESKDGVTYQTTCENKKPSDRQARKLLPEEAIDAPLKISGNVLGFPAKGPKSGIILKADGKFEIKIEDGKNLFRSIGRWSEKDGQLELRGQSERTAIDVDWYDISPSDFDHKLKILPGNSEAFIRLESAKAKLSLLKARID